MSIQCAFITIGAPIFKTMSNAISRWLIHVDQTFQLKPNLKTMKYNYTTLHLETKFSLKNIIPIIAKQNIYNYIYIYNDNLRLLIKLL